MLYPTGQFIWQWNDNENLEGLEAATKAHKFTWQPHGSQFTLVEDVPKDRLAIRIKSPPKLSKDDVIAAVKFDPSWIEILPSG